MKKSIFQRAVSLLLCVATLFGLVAVTVFAGAMKPESTAATLDEMKKLVGTTTYAEYLTTIPDPVAGLDIITIDNSTAIYEDSSGNKRAPTKAGDVYDRAMAELTQEERDANKHSWTEYGEGHADALYIPATGSVTWSVVIPEHASGSYYIRITYFNCETDESGIGSIERKLYLDDYIPFAEAGQLNLTKYWSYETFVRTEPAVDTDEADGTRVEYERVTNGTLEEKGYYKYEITVKNGKKTVDVYKISEDINGNSMAPSIKQVSKWGVYYCQDTTGYYNDYFQFYFPAGNREITLAAEREPVIIESIELVPVDAENTNASTYDKYIEALKNSGAAAPADGSVTKIEAEFPDFVSDSSVASTNDNTSAANYPSASNAQLYNVIGENSYNTVGQWAAYRFTVSKDGLYKFALRYKQDALQGMYICRAVKLSGGDFSDGTVDAGDYGLPDGTPTVPFAEAYDCQFDYNKAWQTNYIGDYVYYDVDGNRIDISNLKLNSQGQYVDEAGNVVEVTREKRDFEFYFKEGVEYTIYLECSLGTLKELIQRVETSLDEINACYLRILQLTGNDPDEYRDYGFIDIMPEVLVSLLEQAKELEAVKLEFEALCGTTGSHITTLHTIALLLDKMGSENGDEIAANMSTLKSYLGTLGTWINNSKRSAMIVDSITAAPADFDIWNENIPKADANFFESIGFEIASFFFSFFTEYDQMGLTTVPDENTRTVDVWLATGRDQSQIWRTMIDGSGSFTETTGVAVTLKLVTGGTLLPSILSGKGPDVYIGLGATDVINYAIREAVYGVSGNDHALDSKKVSVGSEIKDYSANDIFTSNFYTYCVQQGDKKIYTVTPVYNGTENLTSTTLTYDQVIVDPKDNTKNFVDAAMDTVRLEGVTYGIPQTMSFAMMFYRMDVLANLGQEVPETWSELLSLLPVLQTNNMSVGVTYGSALNFMIYQMGGNMWKYPDDPKYAGMQIHLDSDIALEAFDYVCRLYSDYSFPVSFDAANRFRTGEMPIIVGDYATIYNQLVVYATEIAGMWDFTSLPGTTNKITGEFSYDSLAGIGATVLLNGCDDILAAWQFIQWQTSAEVQAEYGNRIVSLIGPSAKYESANVKALKNMSWTASEYEAIALQMENLSSIVNYPGSYIIARYTEFAFLAAVNDGADAVEALSGYIDAINDEIERKRKEFNLPTEIEIGDTPITDCPCCVSK